MSQTPFLPTRRQFVGTLAAAILLPLAGCGGSASEEAAHGSAEKVPEAPAEKPLNLTVGIAAPATLDPARASSFAERQVLYQLFDPLMRYDYATGGLFCRAASVLEVSEDVRTFTFTMRTASFHDGAPVRSEDFKRAWERVARPAGSDASGVEREDSPAAHLLALVEGYEAFHSGEAEELSGLTCPDERTFAVRLSAPYADFPFIASNLALAPVPAAAEDDADAFAEEPVGNGAFMLADGAPGDAGVLSLARFEGHALDTPPLDSIELAVCEGAKDAFKRFDQGVLDVCAPLIDHIDASAASWKAEASDTEPFALTRARRDVLQPEPSVSYLVCNTEVAPFSDPQFRRALALAINVPALASSVFGDTWMPATGVVPPCIHGFDEASEAWAFSAYDEAASIELLDRLYPMDEDGARGIEITLTYSADGGQKRAMEAIAADLAAVGVTCELDAVPFAELAERLRSGDFELGRADWTAEAPCLDAMLYPLFHSSCIGSHNLSRYASGEVDDLLDRARKTVDDTARVALLHQVDALIGRACPVIPYAYPARSYKASERVRYLPVTSEGMLGLAEAELA